MDQENEHDELSFRECCQVVGVAGGFALVLSFLIWVSIIYSLPQSVLKSIPEDFRIGKTKRALAKCVGLVFGTVVLPLGSVASFVAIWQGATGQRTKLTRFILKEISQQKVREKFEQSSQLPNSDQASTTIPQVKQVYLSPKVGWVILLGFVLLAFGFLAWSAFRPG